MPGTCRVLHEQIHRTYAAGHYDNWRVWAGALSIDIDGRRYDAALARAFLTDGPAPRARARCELFVADVDVARVRTGDVEARLWTDAIDAGGTYLPMHLQVAADGTPVPCGNNLVFESAPFALQRTGAFSCTVELSATDTPGTTWVPINDMAENRDGVIVVSPGWVAAAPSMTEVCLRKVDAETRDGRFASGRIANLTRRLAELPTDVVYLLPFYQPGVGDLHTGADVRKGTLGSVYAVADFFRVDPDLVTPLADIDLPSLVSAGCLTDADVADVWSRVAGSGEAPTAAAPPAAELVDMGAVAAARRWGEERLAQLAGRAEVRQLTGTAHELGKRVIFDLVLMQTSRDADLVAEHPEWYVLDEAGQPQIHQIAWLVYSDVALFDLVHNEPLQDYLLEVAPFWIETCGLDGVRIDASQTVDRPFLKRLKNRIQGIDPEALVLGETLCPLAEAVDVPVDMIYALLVDFHRDAERAAPLIRFLEEVHGTFAAGTVAMAYFENHDSPRATAIWRARYEQALVDDVAVARTWHLRMAAAGATAGTPADAALWMALLKNLQATLINATAGMAAVPGPAGLVDERPAPASGTQLAWGMEWGSDWGEETRTDFENTTLLHPEQRATAPRCHLVRAYQHLARVLPGWRAVRSGLVYYHRNEFAGGDPEDRVLAYSRYDDDEVVLAVHNLDALASRWVTVDGSPFTDAVATPVSIFDTYEAFGLAAELPDPAPQGTALRIDLAPLQTRLLRYHRRVRNA